MYYAQCHAATIQKSIEDAVKGIQKLQAYSLTELEEICQLKLSLAISTNMAIPAFYVNSIIFFVFFIWKKSKYSSKTGKAFCINVFKMIFLGNNFFLFYFWMLRKSTQNISISPFGYGFKQGWLKNIQSKVLLGKKID